MGVGVRLGRSVGMTSSGGGRMKKIDAPTAPSPTANSQQPGSQAARAKPNSPGQRAQGLKDQEGSLGGGDNRGEHRRWCRCRPGGC
jgi:hypothetical protein